MENRKIVFATNNIHKLSEVRDILLPRGFEVLSLADIDCHDEIPETADTLEGNALQKARWVKQRYGYDCFADDTGLFVEALDGRPGVYSARYAGEGCTPADNVKKLLSEMKDLENRKASFRTVIAFISADEESLYEGRVDGFIEKESRGTDGFGYDPIFRPEGFDLTFAEMTTDQKNSISHRRRAVDNFVSTFK